MNVLITPLLVCLALTPITPATARYPKNFIFLVDVSGSMEGPEIAKAISAFLLIARQPIDAGSFTIYTFAEVVAMWPEGWQKMPSEDAVRKAQKFLESIVPGNGTQVVPALREAFRGKKKALSVVLITDGFFDEHDVRVAQHLKLAKTERAALGLPPVVLGAIGIHGEKTMNSLAAIAKAGGGGYYSFND